MLALALICTAVAAVANWSTRVHPNERLETVSKPLTTILVIWVAIAANGPRGSTVLAAIGLLFCLAGDIALLDVVDQFVVGLGAFLVGHVVFIAMFVTLHLRHPWWGLIAALVVAVHAVVVGRCIVAGATAQDATLRAPVSAYLVVITSMTVVAVMTGRWWAVVGAIAFVISDTILGWRAFVRERAWMALAVMMTYHAAVVGLALSLRSG
ncbi:MAG: hypothetical protein JWN62_1162 [Acidimicrobiales bacterium]|nr:hypothetical protein [Acidimicrobiales bacterium]